MAKKQPEAYEGALPMRAISGWAEGVSRKDAIDVARGFIQRRFEAVDASWFAVAPFMGGFLWEVHEGGQGKGYIDSIVEALAEDPGGKHWFPCGDRVFQVMMRDGKPFGVVLPSDEGKAVVASGKLPLKSGAKMERAVRHGGATLAFGAATAGVAGAFFAGSLVFFALCANPGPQQRPVKFDMLPHAQWGMIGETSVTQIVTKLEFKDGKWGTETRPWIIKDVNEPSQAPAQRPGAPANQVPPPSVQPPAQGPAPAPSQAPAAAQPSQPSAQPAQAAPGAEPIAAPKPLPWSENKQ